MERWNIGRMECWRDGGTLPFPPPRLSILASWPQPYFIGVLCISKVATKLAKLPLKLAGELVIGDRVTGIEDDDEDEMIGG